MNSDTLEGTGRDLGGKLKETVGDLTGNNKLKGEGLVDQASGKGQKLAGSLSDAIGNPGPLVDKARAFARERPFATAALAGVLGIAFLNTLRGKR